eukprot:45428-Alexandrium_andersonii.AAC.1
MGPIQLAPRVAHKVTMRKAVTRDAQGVTESMHDAVVGGKVKQNVMYPHCIASAPTGYGVS